MSKILAALRVDVDTIKDIVVLPKLLHLLRELEIKATFFIATGPDRTGLNILKYAKQPRNYIKFLKSKPYRYGLHSVNGLLRQIQVQNSRPDILRQISNEGHELGLHGYDHYTWIKELKKWEAGCIESRIQQGLTLLATAVQSHATSFASPGFMVTDEFLHALSTFNFNYSSDYKVDIPRAPFYPQLNEGLCPVLQVPVAMDSIGELSSRGCTESEITSIVKTKMNVWHQYKVPFVTYIHPSFEVRFKFDLLERILNNIKNDNRFIFSTLFCIAAESGDRT